MRTNKIRACRILSRTAAYIYINEPQFPQSMNQYRISPLGFDLDAVDESKQSAYSLNSVLFRNTKELLAQINLNNYLFNKMRTISRIKNSNTLIICSVKTK